MKIFKKGITKRNVKIQIENWGKGNITLVAFPKSKASLKSSWTWYYPVEGEEFRFNMIFATEKDCETEFELLLSGEKELIELIDNYNGLIRKDLIMQCIGNKIN